MDGAGYPMRKWGVFFVTKLLDKFDDSDPSTRFLYSRPSQLCLLEIGRKDIWTTYGMFWTLESGIFRGRKHPEGSEVCLSVDDVFYLFLQKQGFSTFELESDITVTFLCV